MGCGLCRMGCGLYRMGCACIEWAAPGHSKPVENYGKGRK